MWIRPTSLYLPVTAAWPDLLAAWLIAVLAIYVIFVTLSTLVVGYSLVQQSFLSPVVILE